MCTGITAIFTDIISFVQDAQTSKAPFVNRTQQCFAVKSATDGLLDLARTTFCRLSEQIHELVARYETEHQLPGLKVCLSGLLACMTDANQQMQEQHVTKFDAVPRTIRPGQSGSLGAGGIRRTARILPCAARAWRDIEVWTSDRRPARGLACTGGQASPWLHCNNTRAECLEFSPSGCVH